MPQRWAGVLLRVWREQAALRTDGVPEGVVEDAPGAALIG